MYKRAAPIITCVARGRWNTEDFRIYFKNNEGPVSPFHDIPLQSTSGKDVYNMVVEIPRWTNAKTEIATSEPLNPIKHDVKDGDLRYVANLFPYHGYIWNYGAFPQTWEDPDLIEDSTGLGGDDDPLDALELGTIVHNRGEVVCVKVLGVVGLIDENEMDWKLLTLDVNDPLADKINNTEDIQKYMPGYLKATYEWFRNYKIPAGNKPNSWAFNGKPKDKEFALSILQETHESWNQLIGNQKGNKSHLSLVTTTRADAKHFISYDNAEKIVNKNAEFGPPCPVPLSGIHLKCDFINGGFLNKGLVHFR